MTGPEHDIETEACEYAEERGLHHRKLQWIGRRGAPDRIFWGDNVPVFMIEFKAPGSTLSTAQVREISSLRRSGTEVYVCDSPEKARAYIRVEVSRTRYADTV